MESKLKLNEVFYSIQGEGIFQGEPTVFIRFHGCNLTCSYCDTKYANIGKPKRVVTPTILVKELKKEFGLYRRNVCITGGEPLIQSEGLKELVDLLDTYNTNITVETNGSLIPSKKLQFSPIKWVVDYKLPSSGSYPSFNKIWLEKLYIHDQLKFVASDTQDLIKAKEKIDFLRLSTVGRPVLLISPKFNKGKLDKTFCNECIDFCKKLDCRFSLQIHKVIWGVKKGV